MEQITAFLTDFVLPIIIAILGSSWFSAKVATRKMKSDEILQKMEAIDDKVDLLKAENNRARVLRFAGEIRRGEHHDLEEFNDVLESVNNYEQFCKDHPDYPNNRSVNAVHLIKTTYASAYENNKF